jgi:hypothetical protein
MRSRAVICICLIVFVTVSAWPQSPPTASMEVREDKPLQTSQVAKIKNEVQKRGIGEKSKVKVTLRDRTEVKGYISQIDADSFQVTDKNSEQSTTISYQDAMKVRRKWHVYGGKDRYRCRSSGRSNDRSGASCI